jgi:hypothetical protein
MANVEERWAVLFPPLQELKAESDRPWEIRQAEFLDKLGLTEAEQDPVVEAFLSHLADLSPADRAALLRTEQVDHLLYQLLQQSTPVPAAPTFDDVAWLSYLSTHGPYWDGTEPEWVPFRVWFAYEAQQIGLGGPALALLEYLEAQPAADRIATFAQYGVTIKPGPKKRPSTERAPEPASDDD